MNRVFKHSTDFYIRERRLNRFGVFEGPHTKKVGDSREVSAVPKIAVTQCPRGVCKVMDKRVLCSE